MSCPPQDLKGSDEMKLSLDIAIYSFDEDQNLQKDIIGFPIKPKLTY